MHRKCLKFKNCVCMTIPFARRWPQPRALHNGNVSVDEMLSTRQHNPFHCSVLFTSYTYTHTRVGLSFLQSCMRTRVACIILVLYYLADYEKWRRENARATTFANVFRNCCANLPLFFIRKNGEKKREKKLISSVCIFFSLHFLMFMLSVALKQDNELAWDETESGELSFNRIIFLRFEIVVTACVRVCVCVCFFRFAFLMFAWIFAINFTTCYTFSPLSGTLSRSQLHPDSTFWLTAFDGRERSISPSLLSCLY